MRIRGKLVLLLGLIGSSFCLAESLRSTVAGEGTAKKKRLTQVFMREKLEHSQKVLEGLATEDFKLIRHAAQRMQVMSKATEWEIIEGAEYAQLSAEFRRACEQLAKRAEEKNLDAAAVSYLQMTMACIDCHKFVRGTRIAQHNRNLFPGNGSLFVGLDRFE